MANEYYRVQITFKPHRERFRRILKNYNVPTREIAQTAVDAAKQAGFHAQFLHESLPTMTILKEITDDIREYKK